jgi:hypothetical protein
VSTNRFLSFFKDLSILEPTSAQRFGTLQFQPNPEVQFQMMALSRVLILFLSTGLGCQRCKTSSALTVTAFSQSVQPSSHGSGEKSSVSLGSVEDDENQAHYQLLDESILLYSKVSETNNDLQTQRMNELTALIEDVVFDESGIGREATEISDSAEESDEASSSLANIGEALDRQILLGHQSNFSEDELEEWMGTIDALYRQLQTALPPSIAEEGAALSEATPLDTLRGRLESMRAWMDDPEGNAR